MAAEEERTGADEPGLRGSGAGALVGLVVALLVCGALSWTVRELRAVRISTVGSPGWVTVDSDSFYHLRRVDRALREGEVAGTDAYLNFPVGSPIPWPPYYTALLAAALGPFAPELADADGDPLAEEERRAWIEMRVASVPHLLGTLTTLLAVLAGWWLAGGRGAFLAGGYHALSGASIAYTKGGNGDHHAWVALLFGAILVVLTLGFDRRATLERTRAGALLGALAGGLAGLLLGSWVGGLLYVIAVELALVWLLFLQARGQLARAESGSDRGLAALGLGFHLAALATVLPAVASSPWNELNPWMVINLTWFHALFLALGAAVFVPLWFIDRDSPFFARYPWLVGGVLAALFALLALVPNPIGAGVREGFAWVSRADSFMARVGESRPLVGAGRWGEGLAYLGYGALLMPLAWWTLFRGALRGRLALIPLAVAVPFLAVQAARQGRFADVLVLPLAVALGYAFARWTRRLPAAVAQAAGPVGLLLAAALNPVSSAAALEAWSEGTRNVLNPDGVVKVGLRGAANWLRAERPSSESEALEAVLAPWSAGHMLEWAANRPTVATNFGSYVGADSLADPWRFFMEEDLGRARDLLEAREARFVLVPSHLPNLLNAMIEVTAPERRDRYAAGPDEAGRYRARPGWFRTLGARLMFDGEVVYPMGAPPDAEPWAPLDFLRLVYVSPLMDPNPGRRLRSPTDLCPTAFLWERVEGALVEVPGPAGARCEVTIDVRYPKAKRALRWRAAERVGPDGIARLRVPYATDVPNGDGWVAKDGARWSLEGRSGLLVIPDAAVRSGARVRAR